MGPSGLMGLGSLGMILNVGVYMITNVGIYVTTNVGLNMSTNVGLNLTTNVGLHLTTNVGLNTAMHVGGFFGLPSFPKLHEGLDFELPLKLPNVCFSRYHDVSRFLGTPDFVKCLVSVDVHV